MTDPEPGRFPGLIIRHWLSGRIAPLPDSGTGIDLRTGKTMQN